MIIVVPILFVAHYLILLIKVDCKFFFKILIQTALLLFNFFSIVLNRSTFLFCNRLIVFLVLLITKRFIHLHLYFILHIILIKKYLSRSVKLFLKISLTRIPFAVLFLRVSSLLEILEGFFAFKSYLNVATVDARDRLLTIHHYFPTNRLVSNYEHIFIRNNPHFYEFFYVFVLFL